MTNLKKRLNLLEGARTKADIRAMSDDELDAYIATVGAPECYAAMVARVLRHPSAFPVVRDEPVSGGLKARLNGF